MRSRFAVLLAGLALGACAVETTDDGASTEDHLTGPADWDRPVTRPASEAEAAATRAQCRYHRGYLPAETLGAEIPVDANIPIETIVVLMQENRSFDSYFGHLAKYTHRNDIESAPEDASNPERIDDPSSPRHAYQHAKMLCISDTNHEWAGSHLEWNGGKMDGFFQANQGYREDNAPKVPASALDGERSLWWYDERDIPFYYELASTFAIADHYHSSILGPTWPNRDYLYAATSRGMTTAKSPNLTGLGPEEDVLIFDELDKRGITWAFYVDGLPTLPRVATFTGGNYIYRWNDPGHVRFMTRFTKDARDGKLPQVVFLDARVKEDVNGNDEHPPADIQTGQRYVSDRVHELFASPQWKSLALFITYDEHGGIYDHVEPPAACPPDRLKPQLSGEDKDYPGAFDRLGVRVPFILVSPFAKKGYVSHKTYDHTSITRFIETKFKLPALSNRDANADPLMDLFDFANPPFMTPPKIAAPEIDQARLADCKQLFADP